MLPTRNFSKTVQPQEKGRRDSISCRNLSSKESSMQAFSMKYDSNNKLVVQKLPVLQRTNLDRNKGRQANWL